MLDQVKDDFYAGDNGINQEECQSGTIGNQDETHWNCEPCDASKGDYQPHPRREKCETVDPGYYVKTPESGGMCPYNSMANTPINPINFF